MVVQETSAQQSTKTKGRSLLNIVIRYMKGETAAESLELEPLQVARDHATTDHGSKNNEGRSGVTLYSEAASSDDDFVGIEEQTLVPKIRDATWQEFFFPSNIPKEVQLLRWENLAIPVCYLVVGILQGTYRPLLNVWPINLGATEAQQTTLASITSIPAAFKILYGFWSDNVPIYGYRRKPYMLAGWVAASLTMVVLMVSTDLSVTVNVEGSITPARNGPSVQWLGVAFFTYGVALWFADVMADSLVAQKARLEPEEVKGSLQSTCYASRFFGLMVMAPLSSFMYSTYGPAPLVLLLILVPLVMIPLIYLLAEDYMDQVPHISHQCAEIWKTVCQRSVWQPMAFVYLFNLMQVSNAAWRQFLQTNLHFSNTELNMLLVTTYAFLYAGTMIYKYCLLRMSWRRLYQVCIAANFVLTSLQLLLIRGTTLGLPPFWFALGDDAFAEFLSGIQFLPVSILMVSLCPVDSEGASYAMFTTVWNSAMQLQPAISSVLLGIWDVSKETLEAGNLSGLFKLTVLTSTIQVSPILFIGWLPHRRQDLLALSEKPYSSSPIGGGAFLLVLFFSMVYTLAITFKNIVEGGAS